ncbi:MAG: outer membrane beta-barrel protein [Flavobacteriales bacterium]
MRLLFIALFLLPQLLWAQAYNKLGQPNFFGFQYRTILPMQQMQSGLQSFSDSVLKADIQPQGGYTFGGIVRYGLSNLISIETGLYYNQRNYQINATRTDSAISVDQRLRFVQFEVPIQGLIAIQLSKQFYANAALGASILYKPSSVASYVNPYDKHEFRQVGLVDINDKLGFDLRASAGFEWRDKKAGVFYLGGTAFIQLQPAFTFLSRYQYVNFKQAAAGPVNASGFGLDFKYFIPYQRPTQQIFKPGPIE